MGVRHSCSVDRRVKQVVSEAALGCCQNGDGMIETYLVVGSALIGMFLGLLSSNGTAARAYYKDKKLPMQTNIRQSQSTTKSCLGSCEPPVGAEHRWHLSLSLVKSCPSMEGLQLEHAEHAPNDRCNKGAGKKREEQQINRNMSGCVRLARPHRRVKRPKY